jgi:hypothetical protein
LQVSIVFVMFCKYYVSDYLCIQVNYQMLNKLPLFKGPRMLLHKNGEMINFKFVLWGVALHLLCIMYILYIMICVIYECCHYDIAVCHHIQLEWSDQLGVVVRVTDFKSEGCWFKASLVLVFYIFLFSLFDVRQEIEM